MAAAHFLKTLEKIQDILKADAVIQFPSNFQSLLATFNLFQSGMTSGNKLLLGSRLDLPFLSKCIHSPASSTHPLSLVKRCKTPTPLLPATRYGLLRAFKLTLVIEAPPQAAQSQNTNSLESAPREVWEMSPNRLSHTSSGSRSQLPKSKFLCKVTKRALLILSHFTLGRRDQGSCQSHSAHQYVTNLERKTQTLECMKSLLISTTSHPRHTLVNPPHTLTHLTHPSLALPAYIHTLSSELPSQPL